MNEEYRELEKKLEDLTQRVVQLEKAVKINNVQPMPRQEMNQQIPKQVMYNQPMPRQETNQQMPRQETNQQMPRQVMNQQIPRQGMNNEIHKKENKNVEGKIGKTLMGIVASALILFSLILFGGLLLPYLTDSVKFVIMTLISGIFTVVGLKFMKKDTKYYSLFTAIVGVGLSGFYITNLIGYFSFNILNEYMLMFLIVVWLAGTLALGKLKSRLFLYVSNVGLIIATFLATLQWEESYIGIIFYVVCMTILYCMNKSDNYNEDSYFFIQIPIMTLVLIWVYNTEVEVILWVLLNIVVFCIGQFCYKLEKKHTILSTVSLCLSCVSIFIVSLFLWLDYSINWITILPLSYLIIAILCRYKKRPNCEIIYYLSHYIFIISLYFLSFTDYVKDITGFYLIAIILLVMGYLRKDNHFKYPGYCYLFLALTMPPDLLEGSPALLLELLIIGSLYYITYRNYNIVDKYLCLGLTSLWVCYFIYIGKINAEGVYILLSLLCIYVNSKLFLRNFRTKEIETSSSIISYVFTGLLVLIGLIDITICENGLEMYDTEILSEELTVTLIVILTLILSIMNVRRTLKSKLPQILTGFYICIKFTVLMIVVLNRLSITSFGLTLCTFLFAIACIVVGFVKKYKPFRLYGLTLTLLSVLKLVLFDIEYDSNIMKPIGFFIAGILCFGISMGYTMLEKKQSQEE